MCSTISKKNYTIVARQCKNNDANVKKIYQRS